jgi:hypothetical protein
MQSPLPKSEDGNVAPAMVSVAIVGALLALGSLSLFGVRGALSTALGALLAVANLWLLAVVVRSFLGSGGRTSLGPLGVLKLAGLFGLLFVMLKQGLVEVLPLGFGFAALPLGIVLSQLKSTSPARGEP